MTARNKPYHTLTLGLLKCGRRLDRLVDATKGSIQTRIEAKRLLFIRLLLDSMKPDR